MTANRRKVLSILRRVNLISKLFLVSPYKFEKDNTFTINKKLSWFEFLFSVMTVATELSIQMYFTKPSFQGNPYLLLAYIRATFGTLFALFTCFEMKLKHEKIIQIFEEIRSLSSEICFTEKQEKDYSRKVDQFIMVLFIMVALGIINVAYRNEPWALKILIGLHVTKLLSQQVIMEIQFAALIALVGHYIDWVQSNLQQKLTPTVASNQLFVMAKSVTVFKEKWTARKVQELRQYYGRINELKVKINEAFAFRLWLIIMSTFVELVFYIFLNILILQFWNNNRSGFYSPRLIWLNIWVMFVVFVFIQIVNLCETVAEKGRRMGILVHKLFSVSSSENIREELSAFSLELLHRNPSITAYKFFNIDYPLVSSVLGSSVMHIIILLQFQFPDYDDGVHPIQDLMSRT